MRSARTPRNTETRDQLIDAALRVLAAKGPQGATMRKIATEAGVTTGSVMHHFADKQALLTEVLRANNLEARDRVLNAVGDRRGLVALEGAVEALLPIDAERRRTWEVWIAFWRPTTAGEHLTDELRAGRQYAKRLLAELLDQAVADEELPATLNVATEAEMLLTLVAGTGLTVGVESPARMRRDAKRMLATHLARLEQSPAVQGVER